MKLRSNILSIPTICWTLVLTSCGSRYSYQNVTVTISPQIASIPVNGTRVFTTTTTNAPNVPIFLLNHKLVERAGQDTSAGTFTPPPGDVEGSTTYNAPAIPPIYTSAQLANGLVQGSVILTAGVQNNPTNFDSETQNIRHVRHHRAHQRRRLTRHRIRQTRQHATTHRLRRRLRQQRPHLAGKRSRRRQHSKWLYHHHRPLHCPRCHAHHWQYRHYHRGLPSRHLEIPILDHNPHHAISRGRWPGSNPQQIWVPRLPFSRDRSRKHLSLTTSQPA